MRRYLSWMRYGHRPRKKADALEHFKSVDAVKKASVDMLEDVKGMNACRRQERMGLFTRKTG